MSSEGAGPSLWRATELIPSLLYLGNQQDAKQVKALRHYKIRTIINCAIECKSKLAVKCPGEFNVIELSLLDTASETISKSFDQTYRLIDEARERGHGVLVHCVAGASRSPTVCMAYLLRSTTRTLNDIFSDILSKRHFVNPNVGFLKQLMSLEMDLRLISESTLTLSQKRTKKLLELSDSFCALFDLRFNPGVDLVSLKQAINGSAELNNSIQWISFRQIASDCVRALCRFPSKIDSSQVQCKIKQLDCVKSCELVNK